MSKEKIQHFKAHSVNPYMASEDLQADNEDLQADNGQFITADLTIEKIAIEQNLFNRRIGNKVVMWKIAYFKEKALPNKIEVKPMVVNITNLRTMVNGTGFTDMNRWAGARVTVGVQTGLQGKVGGKQGLRILQVYRAEKSILPAKMMARAKEVYQEKGNLVTVEAHYRITDEQLEEIKNEM